MFWQYFQGLGWISLNFLCLLQVSSLPDDATPVLGLWQALQEPRRPDGEELSGGRHSGQGSVTGCSGGSNLDLGGEVMSTLRRISRRFRWSSYGSTR